ncbi:MAG: glycosyltransferase, partial [Candidatus Dadabacteria bacterium]
GKAWYLLGERCSVWFSDKVVADAKVIYDYYKKTYNIDPVVIPYGAYAKEGKSDILTEFSLQPKKYLLYVSRLEPENNALGVIEAYKKSKAQMPLVIVGDAPYAKEYKKKLNQAAKGQNVIFTGFQFKDPYWVLQANCYLYIQATEVGGTHPALVEAMAYGNCIIANGTPENKEVLGDAGLFYEKNNFIQLADLINQCIADPDSVQKFGKLAKERADKFYNWDKVKEDYLKLFYSLVN